jgi:hypothetical protein
MNFQESLYDEERDIALGQELESGRYYLSIPVGHNLCDYEEYYELSPEEFRELSQDGEKMEALADKCRRRENDERLIIKPGPSRGTPWKKPGRS